jgi:hypothetical protein
MDDHDNLRGYAAVFYCRCCKVKGTGGYKSNPSVPVIDRPSLAVGAN